MLFLLPVACGRCEEERNDDRMPPSGFLGAWERDGEGKEFPGSNLYVHIDGGAEIFLELGFETLSVQRYAHEKNGIALEIYQMTDHAAALGIYLMKCGTETPDPGFSERHTSGPYQVLFVKGKSYVKINNTEGTRAASDALLEFARYAEERIPGEVTGGDPFAALPGEGRIAGTERVIRGRFTLELIYTLGKGDVLLLKEKNVTAITADYTDEKGLEPYTLILAKYKSEGEAKEAFNNLSGNLDPYIEKTSSTGTALAFKGYSGKFGRVEVKGPRIEIKVNLL